MAWKALKAILAIWAICVLICLFYKVDPRLVRVMVVISFLATILVILVCCLL